MTPITINRTALSRALWDRILETTELYRYEQRSLFALLTDLDPLREQADYKTGSISAATTHVLWATARYFRPNLIAEVGTYIGRSAMALGYGAGMDNSALVLTCDASNDMEIPPAPNAQLRQYRKQTSTAMFRDMIERKERADLMHLDGRLSETDLGLLVEVTHDDTVFLLDDFEGTEKGVHNAIHITNALGMAYFVLAYPPTPDQLARFDFSGTCNTAMLLPRKLLGFTNQ